MIEIDTIEGKASFKYEDILSVESMDEQLNKTMIILVRATTCTNILSIEPYIDVMGKINDARG